jgi:hypothetical protein
MKEILLSSARSYKKIGIHVTEKGIKYTEYAPGARALSIVQ